MCLYLCLSMHSPIQPYVRLSHPLCLPSSHTFSPPASVAAGAAGFSASLFFGRSFVFHLIQQQLMSLLPLLRSAGGEALSDRCFMLGLCSLIGMREGLLDAIHRRFLARKAAYPEVSGCLSLPFFLFFSAVTSFVAYQTQSVFVAAGSDVAFVAPFGVYPHLRHHQAPSPPSLVCHFCNFVFLSHCSVASF